MDAATLRLNVHRMTEGRALVSVVIQVDRGRRTLVKRLSPSRALPASDGPPAGIDPAAWVLLRAAWVVAGQDLERLPSAVRRPRAPGGATGAHQPNG